jgi:hypothetical protein
VTGPHIVGGRDPEPPDPARLVAPAGDEPFLSRRWLRAVAREIWREFTATSDATRRTAR